VGKRHEALVQDGEPADAGIEDGDGQGAIAGRHGRQWWQAARRAGARSRPRRRAGRLASNRSLGTHTVPNIRFAGARPRGRSAARLAERGTVDGADERLLPDSQERRSEDEAD
jgi:hypothetical protein